MKLTKVFLILLALIVFVPFHVSKAQVTSPGCYTFSNGVYSRVGDVSASGQCPSGSSCLSPAGSGSVACNTVQNNLGYTSLEPLPGQPSGAPLNFCSLLSLLFKVLIYLGGMLAVLFLVLGGISYMVSEVVDKRTLARERIKGAIYGLLLLLVSWIILYTINPQLVNACNIVQPTRTGYFVSPAAVQTELLRQLAANCVSNGGTPQTIPAGTDPTTLCVRPTLGGRKVPQDSCKDTTSRICCDVTVSPTATTDGSTCSIGVR